MEFFDPVATGTTSYYPRSKFLTHSVGNKRGKVFSSFNRNVNPDGEDLRPKPKRKKPRTFERAADLDGEAKVSGRTLGQRATKVRVNN